MDSKGNNMGLVKWELITLPGAPYPEGNVREVVLGERCLCLGDLGLCYCLVAKLYPILLQPHGL